MKIALSIELDIPDDVAKIVDDTVEKGFFQELADTLSRIPDDTPLDANFSMADRLGEYLKEKYGGHFVAPIKENRMRRSAGSTSMLRMAM